MKSFERKFKGLLQDFIFTFFLFVVSSQPLLSQNLSVFETYLNSIESLSSNFRQTNSDKSISNGKIWLKKPGKLRFEYQNPESLLVVANLGFMVVIDKISNTPPQRYLTNKTPLGLLVEENISLSEYGFEVDQNEKLANLMVSNLGEKNGTNLIIHFNLNPLSIRGWTLEISPGEIIKVDLFETTFNMPFDEDLIFGIGGEIQKQMEKISN